jgi:TolB-like protein/Tfp pilus assembly protein PilF
MPFVNMSGDPAKEYLGDGVSEEILNDLSNTPKLHVAARTSSFSFKGKNADIDEIARKLNVGAVLEGSVRQQGARLRIVAQLISAADGFHLWSASYDRDVKDVFGVQDEIAHAIVAALTTKLLPQGAQELRYASPARPRINPDAYTAYLQGRFLMNQSGAPDLLRATGFFKEAIKREPGYADAHASLALVYAVLFNEAERRDTLAPAKDEVAAALRVDPGNFTALLADAQIKRLSWSWPEADSAIQKLLRRYPNSAEAHHFHAVFFEGLGLWEKSVAEQRRAAELDPLVPAYRDNVGQALHFLRRDAEALLEFKRVLLFEPNFVLSLGNICSNYADAGELREAKQILRDQLIPLYREDPNAIFCASSIAYRERDNRELKKIAQFAERLYARGALGASYLPFPYAFMSDYDNAMTWLEKAYDDRDYGVFYAVREPDMPAALTTTPRWRALMQRPAFQEIARVRAQILARRPDE